MNGQEARRAQEAAHAVGLTGLRPVSNGWQRTAEVAGIVAVGMLAAAGVFPW